MPYFRLHPVQICQAPLMMLPDGITSSKLKWYELGRADPFEPVQVAFAVEGHPVAGGYPARVLCRLTLDFHPLCVKHPAAWSNLLHPKQGPGGANSGDLVKKNRYEAPPFRDYGRMAASTGARRRRGRWRPRWSTESASCTAASA